MKPRILRLGVVGALEQLAVTSHVQTAPAEVEIDDAHRDMAAKLSPPRRLNRREKRALRGRR